MNIQWEPEAQRTAAYINGELVGICQYTDDGQAWRIIHTETAPAFQGQGIARQLVLAAAKAGEQEGREIIPVCSYAVKVLR